MYQFHNFTGNQKDLIMRLLVREKPYAILSQIRILSKAVPLKFAFIYLPLGFSVSNAFYKLNTLKKSYTLFMPTEINPPFSKFLST